MRLQTSFCIAVSGKDLTTIIVSGVVVGGVIIVIIVIACACTCRARWVEDKNIYTFLKTDINTFWDNGTN